MSEPLFPDNGPAAGRQAVAPSGASECSVPEVPRTSGPSLAPSSEESLRQENADLRNLLHGATAYGQLAERELNGAFAVIASLNKCVDQIRPLPCTQGNLRSHFEEALFKTIAIAAEHQLPRFQWSDLADYAIPDQVDDGDIG